MTQLQISEDRINNGSGQELITRNTIQFNPNVEFPSFDGLDPKGWIKKCTRYFGLCRNSEDQKVDLAVLHLRGSLRLGLGATSWEEEM